MAIDPKQERVLRDGTASPADRPRRIDRQSVRAQAENPPVERRRTNGRRTAAVADIRVNLPSGTPVEEFSRAAGAERIPELGGRSDRDEPERDQPAPESAAPKAKRHDRPAVETGEARRAMKARREHSKGDGNFPSPEPRAELIEERPEDRTPRDVPKARDDRSAPKGNATTGQADRNPRLEVRDENGTAKSAAPKKAAAGRGRRSSGSRAPAKSKPQAASKRRSTARGTSAPKRQTERPAVSAGQRGRAERPASGKSRSPQMKAAAARGSRKPVTKRALRRSGPRPESGSTRGGKR